MRLIGSMHVLAVRDLAATCAWYRDVMGFEVQEIGDDGWRILVRDECRFMAGECVDEVPAADTGNHSYCAYLYVDEAAPYYEFVRDRGAAFIKTLRDEPWGMREFGVRTIDGHRIMFGQKLYESANGPEDR